MGPGALESNVTFALHDGSQWVKMAENLNSEFWRSIEELKLQLQSMHRIERLHRLNEESDKENVVRIEELSR